MSAEQERRLNDLNSTYFSTRNSDSKCTLPNVCTECSTEMVKSILIKPYKHFISWYFMHQFTEKQTYNKSKHLVTLQSCWSKLIAQTTLLCATFEGRLSSSVIPLVTPYIPKALDVFWSLLWNILLCWPLDLQIEKKIKCIWTRENWHCCSSCHTLTLV